MSEADNSYELEMLKMVINQYLDQSTSLTKISLNELKAKRDQIVWELATKIYQQSGHKIGLSLVRDIVNSRIRSIEHQLTEEARRIAEQKTQQVLEEARRIAEAEEARRIAEVAEARRIAEVAEALRTAESDPQFLAKVTEVFSRVRKTISEQLGVEESEVNLDSHLSNHLNANECDLVEVLIALEEEFNIEIPDEESENHLDISINLCFSSGSWWSSSSSSPSSSKYNAGEKCIVRNFVELICKKVLN
jgi:acyl carrier protein